MGVLVRAAIVVGVIWALSPMHGDATGEASVAGAAARSQLPETRALSTVGEDLARLATSEAARHVTPALAATLWNRIDAADRDALARAVLESLTEDPAPVPARHRRSPQG